MQRFTRSLHASVISIPPPILSVSLQVGDLVEFNSKSSRSSVQGVVVAVSKDALTTFDVLTGHGIQSLRSSQVLFKLPLWLDLLPAKPDTSSTNEYTTFNASIPEPIRSSLALSNQTPSSTMDAVFDLVALTSSIFRKNETNLDALYGRIESFLAGLKQTPFTREVYISLDNLSRLVFTSCTIIIDMDTSSGSKVVLKTVGDAKLPTSPQILSTYQYLKAAGSSFFEPRIASVTAFQSERLFRVLTKEEIWEIQFMQRELAAYNSRRSVATSTDGDSLRSFISKVSLVSKDKKVVSFTEEERVFIGSARDTLLKNQASFSPIIELFYGVYRILSKANLMTARMNPKAAALELVQMIGMDLRDFPICVKASIDYGIDVLTSDRKDVWSHQLNAEINLRADTLISGIDTPAQNESVYEHLKSSIVGAIKSNSQLKPVLTARDSIAHLRQEHTLPVYVIDSLTANELDDGFSIEPVLDTNGNVTSHWIHVHIADPTALISPSDPVSVLSQAKGSSIYLPDRHHPLLPYALTNGAFGLCDGGKALTFSARIGSDGDICDWRVSGSVLKTVKKISYDETDIVSDWSYINVTNPSLSVSSRQQLEITKPLTQLGSTANIKSDMARDLIKIQELTHRHLAFRARNGGLIPDTAELSICVNRSLEETTVCMNAYSAPHLSPSHRAVAESMIIAGRVAAKFCSAHKLPAPYRGQAHILSPSFFESEHSLSAFKSPNAQSEKDQLDLVKNYEHALVSRDQYGVLSQHAMTDLYGHMSAGVNDLRPISHFSMGIPGIDLASETAFTTDAMHGYVKTTSPLRRYLDMVIHWQIKTALLRDSNSAASGVFSAEDLKILVPRLADIDKRIKKVSGVFESAWLIEWVRRRESYFSQHGVDLLHDPLLAPRSHLGIGLSLNKAQGIRPPIRRRYEDNITSPVYRVVVLRAAAREVEGASKWASIRDAVVVELGGKKVEVFGRIERFAAVKPGDILQCRVLTSDPYSNYLRMYLVE